MFAAFALVLTITIVSATAFAAASPHDPGVTAIDGTGRRLGTDPTVPIGQHIILKVSGFAPGTVVTMRAPAERTISADARGVATLVLTAASIGPHQVTLFGAPAMHGRPGAGNVRVLVPRIAHFSFHVASAAVAGTHGQRTASGPSRRLAGTGVDVTGWVTGGLLALAFGLGLDRAGRRDPRASS